MHYAKRVYTALKGLWLRHFRGLRRSGDQVSPGPGYVCIRQLDPSGKEVARCDYENEHLLKTTLGVVVSMGPRMKRPVLENGDSDYFSMHHNGMWSEFPEVGYDIQVGDKVFFNYLYNLGEPDFDAAKVVKGHLIIRYDDIRAKIENKVPVGVGEYEVVRIDMSMDKSGDVEMLRESKDIWDKGYIGDRLAVLYPKMAFRMEYQNTAEYPGYYAIKRKFIFGYV